MQPIRIYAGSQICQISYHTIDGAISEYDSKYQHSRDIKPSLLHRELDPDAEEKNAQMKLPFGQGS